MQEQSPNQSHVTSFPLSVSPDRQHAELPEGRDQGEAATTSTADGSVNLVRQRGSSEHPLHPQQTYHPPPIDFTGYQGNRPQSQPQFNRSQQEQHRASSPIRSASIRLSPAQSQSPYSSVSLNHNRKRSFSAAEGERTPEPHTDLSKSNRLSSISSILNPTRQTASEEVPIDPSLSTLGYDQHHQQRYHYQLPPPNSPSPGIRLPPVANDDPGGKERLERRAQLRREAEEMRELLRAKEMELAELGGEL